MKSMIKISQDNAAVYSDASIQSSILCSLRKDEILLLLDTVYIDVNKWNKIQLFKGVGYLYNAEFFKLKLIKIMTKYLYLRSEPDSNARIIRECNKGDKLYLCDRIDTNGYSWFEVRTKHYSNNRGYILDDFSYQFEESTDQ